MPLEVIGAGHGRTGTTSLKTAINQLGFGPCHHMRELIFQHPERFALWERAFEEKAPVDWDEVFAGYRSTIGEPSAQVYRALAAHYPKAKVILTVRDPQSWWRSAEATVHASLRAREFADSPLSRMNAKAQAYSKRRGGVGDFIGLDREAAIAEFNRHNEEVRRVIPPERLLVFEVKQGWAPLCKFLGVPVPATPFPLANTTEEYQALVRNMAAQGKPS